MPIVAPPPGKVLQVSALLLPLGVEVQTAAVSSLLEKLGFYVKFGWELKLRTKRGVSKAEQMWGLFKT